MVGSGGKTGKAGNKKMTGVIKNLLIHLSLEPLPVPGLRNAITRMLAYPKLSKVSQTRVGKRGIGLSGGEK